MNKFILFLLFLLNSTSTFAGDYITGGWSQSLTAIPKPGMTTVMYGMITNLKGLTVGTATSPGWSVKTTPAPLISGSSLWSYGGAGCAPVGMPETADDIDNAVSATNDQCWDGIDIDNECGMNSDTIIKLINKMKWKQTSYTFMGGHDFNHPEQSEDGETANNEVLKIHKYSKVDRFILMMYGDEMWPMEDVVANVGPGMKRLLDMGIDKKKIIATVTTDGLTVENLNHVIDQVLKLDVGGLFIWNYEFLSDSHLNIINARLSISNGAVK